jgi:hypothetical protein
MSSAGKPPTSPLVRPWIEGPITQFPEDVGWTVRYHRPTLIHVRKMGTEFIVAGKDGQQKQGQPGDFLVVGPDGAPTVASAAALERIFMEAAPSVPAPPPPPEWSEGDGHPTLTEQQKVAVNEAVEKFVTVTAERTRALVFEVSNAATNVVQQVKAAPTRAPLYGCPFCDKTSEKKEEMSNHLLLDHFAKAMRGGQ